MAKNLVVDVTLNTSIYILQPVIYEPSPGMVSASLQLPDPPVSKVCVDGRQD